MPNKYKKLHNKDRNEDYYMLNGEEVDPEEVSECDNCMKRDCNECGLDIE